MINQKLRETYSKKIIGLKNSPDFAEEVDGPILMHCWEEEYLKSNYKILYVGQESNGWIGYMDDNITASIDAYKQFAMSKNGNRSIFWQHIYKINSALNPNQAEGNNFLWTNVSKFTSLDGTALDWNTHLTTVNKFNCLKEEIDITKPDVVMFLSGPNYDDKIKLQFNGEVKFKTFLNRTIREIAQLEHPDLPEHSYRTYHPNYLQRSKKSFLMDELIVHLKGLKL